MFCKNSEESVKGIDKDLPVRQNFSVFLYRENQERRLCRYYHWQR